MTEHDPIHAWLAAFLDRHGASAGTVHIRRGDVLRIAASVAIPDAVIAATRVIPRGKGMAGLAWERGQSVTTCNLQDDASGSVRPGAKAVGARAAAALPVVDDHGDCRAVVGMAWMDERDISDAQLQAYERDAASLAQLAAD